MVGKSPSDPTETLVGALNLIRFAPSGTTSLENRGMASKDEDTVTQVKSVLSKWEAAWNAADMNAMWQLATDEVHWVNVVGQHWRGKHEVQRAHQANFDQLFKGRTCKLEEIESIEALPGGTLVAVVRWEMGGYRRPSGVMRPPGRDRMSLVLVRRGNDLAIAHGANVPIDEAAAAHDPIKR
jgi:uncharacterized protein (TIGR02246 family)